MQKQVFKDLQYGLPVVDNSLLAFLNAVGEPQQVLVQFEEEGPWMYFDGADWIRTEDGFYDLRKVATLASVPPNAVTAVFPIDEQIAPAGYVFFQLENGVVKKTMLRHRN